MTRVSNPSAVVGEGFEDPIGDLVPDERIEFFVLVIRPAVVPLAQTPLGWEHGAVRWRIWSWVLVDQKDQSTVGRVGVVPDGVMDQATRRGSEPELVDNDEPQHESEGCRMRIAGCSGASPSHWPPSASTNVCGIDRCLLERIDDVVGNPPRRTRARSVMEAIEAGSRDKRSRS